MSLSPELRPFAFVLAVPDLARNLSYFQSALGFRLEWEVATDWALVSRGSVRVMLGNCPDALAPQAIGDHSYFGYLHVDNVDALYDEFLTNGALILQSPVDRPHGMREITVATPDGHRLVIGQAIPAPSATTETLP